MNSYRIIPCLDVDKGKVVKGRKFKDVQEVADPLTLAKKYVHDGADELVFYDITASSEKRAVFIELIAQLAKEVPIPFTVGGGIRSLDDIQSVIDVGADKVSLNSVVLENPSFIAEAAKKFGSEKIVFSMDVKEVAPSTWHVFARGGQKDTGLDAIEWALQGEANGAGEIVLNSIDGDGEKDGYSLELTKIIAEAVSIPVVASGGAGKMEDFKTVLTEGKADAALAASVFHYEEITIQDLKAYLKEQGLN
ncbi:imidazole glycerol phosphate synthase subunit HisF [Sporosarcina ureilytica]|uniref:imidazole glycerol phosphate synthase subunit HisF n=1 Tax=Sporosarcina ureilytica TaxID=298596 RepID=UPI00094DA43F|nr:imidazole glycerol phosphate synthase subunit HisF [Sporosarcina ureilytica]